MKLRYITVDNYKDFKPSELIHSFISDIEVAENSGLGMRMWAFTVDKSEKCLPCLGGMACLGFGVDWQKEHEDSVARIVANIGDFIRNEDDGSLTIELLRDLYPELSFGEIEIKNPEYFDGTIYVKEMARLKAQVMKYVHALEKQGL